jgi:hypothetical protein
MNIASAELLQRAFDSFGNTIARDKALRAEDEWKRQALEEARRRSAAEEEYRNKTLEQQATRDTADAEYRKGMLEHANRMENRTEYRWKSGGVEHSANSIEQFQQEIQRYPADKDEKGKTSLRWTGTMANGAEVALDLAAPADLASNDEAKQQIGQVLAFLNKTVEPVGKTNPGFQTRAGWDAAKRTLLENTLDDAKASGDPQKIAIAERELRNFDMMIPKGSQAASGQEFDTVTTTIPGTEGKPGVPGVPGEKRSFLGIDSLRADKPAIPAVPAVPGTPERRITTKVPRGTALAEPAPAASPAQPAGTGELGVFESEVAARAAGHKSGDVVRLKGIGKVRLK